MKYLLLDEDQTALFNYRLKIDMKSNLSKPTKYSDYYNFSKGLNDEVKIDLIKKQLALRKDNKIFNSKLLDLA